MDYILYIILTNYFILNNLVIVMQNIRDIPPTCKRGGILEGLRSDILLKQLLI